jgi:hypothetical protein
VEIKDPNRTKSKKIRCSVAYDFPVDTMIQNQTLKSTINTPFQQTAGARDSIHKKQSAQTSSHALAGVEPWQETERVEGGAHLK